MTPSPSTPQPADRASARRRVRQVLTRARTLWRDMTGESAYDRYLERYAREHAQCPHGSGQGSEHGSGHGPMSEREFWRARAKQAETEINASCC
ncbi:YbdD/YjiX family protein [Actinomyces oris]|uniref:YbdD/YjiX family protein n=1 Tax=Actinomyces oris TaxID=544580 RepID=UPI0022FD96D7|nr:YbdD/YjiX family protein [Actinomyces oris]WCA43878.1 YbdD/YjiX family protein [Actinomyces oris]